MSEQDKYIRIELTSEQIQKAHETFFEIAQNLQQIQQDTQKLESLDGNEKAQLIEQIDLEDHLTFKAMMFAAGLGDIDSGEFLGVVGDDGGDNQE